MKYGIFNSNEIYLDKDLRVCQKEGHPYLRTLACDHMTELLYVLILVVRNIRQTFGFDVLNVLGKGEELHNFIARLTGFYKWYVVAIVR